MLDIILVIKYKNHLTVDVIYDSFKSCEFLDYNRNK